MYRRTLLTALVAVGGLVFAQTASASKIKLVLDGNTAKASTVQAYSFEASNVSSIGSAGGGATGRAKFEDLVITKSVDTNTASLLDHLANGTNYDKAALLFTAGPFAVSYCLNFVIVPSVKHSATKEDNVPTEEVALAFGAVTVKTGLTSFSWDIVHNETGPDNC